MDFIGIIASELNIKPAQVKATAELLSQEATVPFISRYRKEMTGSLDETQITYIRDRIAQLEELEKRRAAILKSLEERELLTDELKDKILTAESLTELEDIYLPYRPKRRTRATIAKEKGLEPLAEIIFQQEEPNPDEIAVTYINEEKGVLTVDDALAGARDIIAERISEDKQAREKMRILMEKEAFIFSKIIDGKEEEGIKYRDYYEWKEPALRSPSHRILAIMRGENEGFLRAEISPEVENAVKLLENIFIKSDNASSAQVKLAVSDGYKRLLKPGMETEFRNSLKEKADEEAVKVFAENLRQLLLAPPLGEKSILAIDPGFRTGCKVVCLNRQGKLLHNETIYPHTSDKQRNEAETAVRNLVKNFKIEAVAIGNGTAGRETEIFIKSLKLDDEVLVIMVNESGASIYSASEVARKEFPDYDVTVRGAVSIGRRLIDPLAELVKIDPKSIGVGQYQHDVNQTMLRNKLDDVVISCVNKVGVDLNTASIELLTYVSGLGPKLAAGIIEYRDDNGPFSSRDGLKKVKRLGGKAFEQSAGFLRIKGSENPLDETAVHPESYVIVNQMANDLGLEVRNLIRNKEVQSKIDLNKYISGNTGLPTLQDIMNELLKPGRDPRSQFIIYSFDDTVNKIEDLKPGMKLPGVVTNITNFGAFIDIGVHQDGLVHISQIANKFVKNPNNFLKVNQKVTVTVLEIDLPRKRIQLTMKQ